jgi:ethanolamine phosphate phosphodiesterase
VLLPLIDTLQDLRNENAILFTHIPLHRPGGSDCGPFRERGTIRAGTGRGYQNMLSAELSRFILDKIRPVLVLRYALHCRHADERSPVSVRSGDDHDYCEYIHESHGRKIREVTVKSFSMAMGVRRPGFQLISIPEDGGEEGGHMDQLCLLPDQLRIYLTVYLSCLALTILILLVSPSRQGALDKLPISAPSEIQEHKRRVLMNMAQCFCPRTKRRGRRGGCMHEFMKDFWDVARVPLSVFLLVTMYVLFF